MVEFCVAIFLLVLTAVLILAILLFQVSRAIALEQLEIKVLSKMSNQPLQEGLSCIKYNVLLENNKKLCYRNKKQLIEHIIGLEKNYLDQKQEIQHLKLKLEEKTSCQENQQL